MQKKLRVAICDDDSAARNIITSSLRGAFAGQEIEVHSYASAQILAADLSVHSFDLLLLDIDMPDLDGITFAEGLRQENAAVDIIYISNREDKVFQSLRTEPCGFIRKSRFLEDMNDVISRYLSKRAARGDADIASLVIQDRTCMRNLPLRQIIYVEGLRKVQLVHAVGELQPLTLHSSMQELEEKLWPHGFLRIHKGYLVNYQFISQIEQTEVLLTNGESLPLSRRKLQEVKEAYLELMQSSSSLIF
ncbi:MAG: LytR/AlgR family response regulator transcription factor [Candidatus Onthomonas sp.]